MAILKRKLKREMNAIYLNLESGLENARVGLDQLRSKEVLDVDKTIDCLERLINNVAKQNARLFKAFTR